MHYQAKLLTLSPHIDSKKSDLNILVNDEFLILHNDAVEFLSILSFVETFHVITFNFISFYSVRRLG